MNFASSGHHGRLYRQYLRLKNGPARDRYLLDPVLKHRLRALGFDMALFYPQDSVPSFDDVTIYMDSDIITFDAH
jgi:hypothetical protein